MKREPSLRIWKKTVWIAEGQYVLGHHCVCYPWWICFFIFLSCPLPFQHAMQSQEAGAGSLARAQAIRFVTDPDRLIIVWHALSDGHFCNCAGNPWLIESGSILSSSSGFAMDSTMASSEGSWENILSALDLKDYRQELAAGGYDNFKAGLSDSPCSGLTSTSLRRAGQ